MTDGSDQISVEFLCLMVFIDMVGVGTILPVVSAIPKSLQMSAVTQGFLNSFYACIQLLSNPIMGKMSDVYGRKNIFLLSLAGSAVSYLILGSATNIWMVLISRFIVGLVKQTLTISRAIVVELYPSSTERSNAFNNVMTVAALAFVIGPSIGSYLLALYGPLGPAYASVIFYFFAFFLVLFYMPNKKSPPLSTTTSFTFSTFSTSLKNYFIACNEILKKPFAARHFILRLFQSTTTSIRRHTYTLIIVDTFGLDVSHVGYYISYTGVVAAVSGLFLNPVNSRLSEPNRFKFSAIGMGLSQITTCLITSIGHFNLILPFLSFFDRMGTTVTMAAYSSLFQGEQGLVMGLYGSVDSIGGILGPIIGGFLYQYGGIPSVYGFCSLFLITSYLIGNPLLLDITPRFTEVKMDDEQNTEKKEQ